MNGPFVVAQANSTSSGATPVQVIKLFKPTAGHTEIFHASFSGLVKIDFSAIANEKITLFHDSKNQSLHIIFADGSQDIIEPFFDSRGIMSNLLLDMGSGQEFNGERFASQFPITEDQSVLPAAGPGGVASGADFHGPFVDGLFTGNPLDLLPPEELPGLQFTITATPLLTEDSFVPFTFGNLNGLVEEEELRFQVQQEERPVNNVANGDGNEDNNDKSNNDADNLPTDNTTNIITGDFSTIVHGGVGGPLTFVANAGANGHAVFAADGVTQITSIGEKVVYELHGANEIWGVTVPQHEGESERTIFILHIDSNGQFTFTLTDQIDHPLHSHDDSSTNPLHQQGIFEETLDLDLSIAVGGHDAANNQFVLPAGKFDVGVIDDTPIVINGAHENVFVDENDIDTDLSHGTSPNDGNGDGSFTGSPGDNLPGPATVSGDLSGLVKVGADAVDAFNHGTFAFTTDGSKLDALETVGLKSQGHLLEYTIVDTDPNDGFQILRASTDDNRTVFELKLFSDGHFDFSLFDQVDHDPPFDTDPPGFISQDPTSGGNNFPLSDRNTDLIDNDDPNGNPRILDIDQINFGALIDFSDFDHDTVNLDGAFTISIRDDVPKLVHGEVICLTVDEDDISTLGNNPNPGSLGTSPDDGNGDGSFTGDPNDGNSKGPATVFGTMGGNVVVVGADEPLTFSFTGNAVSYFLSLGLESQGHHLSYEVVGNELIGFVDTRVNIGTAYDDGIDRLVFKFTITDVNTGDFKFELSDQLDHDPPPNGTLADQNFGLVDSVHGQDVTALDFGHVIKATDFDGDSVVLNNKVEIHVRDDVPVLKYGASDNAIVDEDDINNFDPNFPGDHSGVQGSTGSHPHDGNSDGSFTGGPGDTTTGPAFVSGSLANLVQSGADEPLTFSFINTADARDYLQDLGLQSKGGLINYDFSHSGEIIGFVNNPSGPNFTSFDANNGDREVFALTLNPDGTWTFKLFDQVDHDPPYDVNPPGFNNNDDPNFPGNTHNPDADQNTDLIDNDDPNGNPRDFDVSQINFGHIIQATDFDGDSVILDHAFTITIRDDIPTVHASAVSGTSVIVDETAGQQNDDSTNSGVIALFSGVSNKGTDPDMSTQYAHGNNAVVSASITIGADEGGSAHWSLSINGGNGTDSGLMTTAGKHIFLFEQGGLIVGRFEGGGNPDPAESNDVAAFAIAIDDTGHISIAQFVSLQHPNTGSNDEDIFIGSGKISAVITVTDFDNDVATDSVDLGGKIGFSDDGPNPDFHLSSQKIIHDETPGVDGDANDVAPSAALDTLFSAVTNIIQDPDVPHPGGEPAIGYAVGSGPIVSVTPNFGADGPGTVVYAIDVPGITPSSTTGVTSGLFTTDGHEIFLFEINSHLVVGRYDGSDAGTGVGTNDPAAFAINIDPNTGVITVAQYQSIKHDDRGDPDEANDNGNNANDAPPNDPLTVQQAIADSALRLTVTVTDGDNDPVSHQFNIGDQIIFQDDGPSVTVTAANSVANSFFFDGFVENGNIWGSGSGVAVGTSGAWAIGNSDTGQGGAGAIQLERVADGYEGMHSSTNGFMVDLDATPHDVKVSQVIGGLTSGESYLLTFDAGAPFPSEAHLEVWFGGQLVDDIAPGGTMQTYSLELFGGSGNGSNLLEFRETGTPDNQGTYLANVKMADVIVIDETPGVQADSNDTTNPAIAALFAGVANVGVDPDMPPQFATGSSSAITATINFGADGPKDDDHNGVADSDAIVYSLSTTNGIDSGLATTEGKEIFLFNEGNLVVGRFDSDGIGGVDEAAFALAIGADGHVSVAQYVSLHHPDEANFGNSFNSYDEGIYLNNGTVSATVTVTDGDHDTASQSADISKAVRFEDDGPTVSGVTDAGAQDELGASILDDEDTTLNPAFEIQGGPGDDGHGVVATGQIHFNAGADGLKSIVVGGIDGLKAIWVDVDGIGHPESVTQVWTPDGLGGGTLIGTSTHFLAGNPIFTLVVDNAGHYTFTLDAPLNHPLTDDPSTDVHETSFEDNLNLGFGFTITDGDNDTATGTLHIDVDDDSPEFFNGGIEDATVTQLNVGVTENLNIHFGADGQHEGNSGLQITGWPDLPGITETLSGDGKTLTATIDNTNGVGTADDDVLYTLHLNTDGTYTFTQVHALPGGTSILPTSSLSAAYGPTPSHDYGDFVLTGLNGGNMNGSGAGAGVNDNNMNVGDQFQIAFDNQMDSATLGINFAGNGHLKLHWTALDNSNNVVGSGDTASFGADGLITIDPANPFFKLNVEVDFVDGPNESSPKFKLTGIGGETEGTTPIDDLTFKVTGVDGDGDSVSDAFAVKLEVTPPLSVSGTFSGTVEEEQLQPASATSGSFAITASGNEDTDDATNVLDNDTSPGGFSNITNVQVGAFTVTGGDLTYVFKLAAGLEGTQVQKTAGGGLTSGGQNVLYHEVTPDHLIGYVENGAPGSGFKLGVDRVIFALDITGTGSYTFTLYDRVDHPNATSGGPTTEENISINLNNVVLVDDENGETALVQGSIAIIDDTPLVNVGLSTQLGAQHIALELDETVQPDGASNPSFDHYNGAETESTPTVGSNGGSDDVAPGAPNVYNHVPVVSTAPLANQAIGSKTTAAGSIHDMFTGFTPLFGADGPHAGGDSVTYGLKFTLAGNVATNLVATDTGDALLSALSDAARHIHLVQVSNTVIEGRLDGADGIGGSTADEYVAFRMTLNNPSDPAIATIKVDQFLAIDHDLSEDAGNQAPESPSLFDENVVMKLVQGGSLGLELDATAKDGDSDIATSSATLNLANSSTSIISFDDDGPTAVARTATTGEGQVAAADVVLIIDTSGSMGPAGNGNGGSDPDGPGGFASRLDMVKAAVQELFNSGAVHSVFIVDFNSDATFHNSGSNGGWYTNLADAMAAINALNDNNSTDYDAAIQSVTDHFVPPPPGGDRLVSMFLSDGQPNESNGTGSNGIDEDDTDNAGFGGQGEETHWINFLTGHGFDASYALGFGGLDTGDKQQLEPIAWAPGETADNPYDADAASGANDPNVIIITDLSSIDGLVNALITSIGGSAAGNVITNATAVTTDDANFGTDGHGFVGKLVTDTNHDGILGAGDDVYTFDGTTILKNGLNPVLGNQVTFDTGFGGHMHFNFLSGAWDYTAPNSVPATFVDHFNFTLVDGDGDGTPPTGLDITVTKPNQVPTITSGATGTETENTVNTHVVYDTNATDPDSDTITYSLSAGGDNNFFNINSSTGEVTFKVSPNFESPGDAGGNNVYDITVHANDGHGHDVTKAVAITVSDVNEFAPVINSNGGGASAAINVVENTTAVTTVTATDADAGSSLTYSLAGGLDAAKFSINSTTGALSFISAPDFEAPTDNGPNNIYNVNVQVSDGTNTDTQAIAVTVTNAANEPPLAVADHIISNFGGSAYNVPEWAFLSNDSDPDGNAIDVNSVTNGSGNMTLGHTPGVGTNGTIDINDNGNGSDGNTFTYNDTDGSLVGNSATVTVDNKNGGDLTGTANADILFGDGNGNTFDGAGGIDIILAGGGNDTIIADQNDRVIDGGSGTDTLSVGANFTSTSDAQIVGIENVTLTTAATLNMSNQTEAFTITGSSGADTITGGSAADSINAGDGNDVINGGHIDTLLNGGNGTDTLNVDGGFTSLSNAQIQNIENVVLTSAGVLDLSNQIEGFNITGSSGADTITGGAGSDSLTGNGGNDQFVLASTAAANGHDDILDFSSGNDDIFVDVASQANTVGTANALGAGNFHSVTGAAGATETDANSWNGGTGSNEFLYNQSTKELWYSANGTGTDRVDLAHMATGVPVAADVHTF